MDYKLAFIILKNKLLQALILAYFSYNKKTCVETDLFNEVLGGVLLQLYKENSDWHPVIFYFKIIYNAKYNYSIYNKKLIAIIKIF